LKDMIIRLLNVLLCFLNAKDQLKIFDAPLTI